MNLYASLLLASMLVVEDTASSAQLQTTGDARTTAERVGRVAVPKDKIKLGCDRTGP